jgi:hypothetical protein
VTSESAEDARWAAAAEMSTTVGDDGLFPRWFKPVVWIGLVVIVVVLFGAGMAIAFAPLAGAAQSSRVDVSTLLSTVGSVVTFGAVAWAVKTDRFYSQWNSVSSPLNTRDLKTARRQMAGKQDEIVERVPVLRAIAEQELRIAPVSLLVVSGLMLLTTGLLLQADDVLDVIWNAIVLVLLVLLTALQVKIFVRDRRFLATHRSEQTLET